MEAGPVEAFRPAGLRWSAWQGSALLINGVEEEHWLE
jgi:hypothetical protein